MKNITKLFSSIIAGVLLFSVGISLFSLKATAAPKLSPSDDYKIWRSAELLAGCVGPGGYKPDEKKANAQDAINNLFEPEVKFQDGKLYGRIVGGTNNVNSDFDCNTNADIGPAIDALGISNGIYGLYEKLGGNALSKSQTQDALRKFATEKGATPNLSQKPDFQFWFWNQIFSSTVDEGGCSGKLSDKESSTASTNLVDDTKPFYAVPNGATEPIGYRVASFNVGFGKEIEAVDGAMTGTLTGVQGSRITCVNIARQLNKTRADAYFESLKTNPAAAAANATPATSDTTANADTIEAQCTASFVNPASWIICPLITGFAKAVQELDTQITNQLTIKTDDYFTGSQGTAFKQVWTSMRNIALAFIVIVGLLMVIGTAIEVGPFDPYTVKKVMPRLLVAVIVISLSWPLVIFLIEASNSLGYTIRGLIEAPFKDSLNTAVQFGGGQQWLAGAGLVGLAIALGPIGILSFVGTAFLAVLIAFLTIILRQILVILLAVLAPIAIAMYILPNTQKAGKTWWDLFSKALLVFPIIAAFIATGRVFAVIAATGPSGENSGTLKGLIAFAAYFGPYFALPFAFRLAGGAIGQIGGFVNDRSRGGFDRLKKFRQGQTQQNARKIQEGERFRNTGALRGLNNPLQAAAIVGSGQAGLRPSQMRGKLGAAQAQNSWRQGQELLEKNEAFRAIANDDHMLEAARYGTSAQDIERRLRATGRYRDDQLAGAVGMVQAAQNSGSRDAVNIASALGRARTGTGYDTHADMLREIAGASDDVAVRNAMIASAKSASNQAGRTDLGTPSHTAMFDAMQNLEAGDVTDAQTNENMRQLAFEQGGPGAMLSMKADPFRTMTTQLAQDYRGNSNRARELQHQAEAARQAGNQADANRLTVEANQAADSATTIAAQMVSLRTSMGGASSDNRVAITDMLSSVGIDTSSQLTTDRQLGAQLSRSTGADADVLSTEVRSRAGSYEQAGGQQFAEQNARDAGSGTVGPQLNPPGL